MRLAAPIAAPMACLVLALSGAPPIGQSNAQAPQAPLPSTDRIPAAGSMRLGLLPERWQGAEFRAQRVIPERDKCRRWKAMAHQLGETYAGHALREGVLKRVCWSLGSERAEDVWDWPWSGIAKGLRLPPRVHQINGAWQIRCGAASMRRRCALIYMTSIGPDATLNPAEPAVVVHFVIDMVARRESVLWRVFVPQERLFTDGLQHEAGLQPSTAARDMPREHGRVLRYSFGASDYTERFSTCTQAGCMMEASLRRAGEVATNLWDGHPIELTLPRTSGPELDIKVPAKGFRAALAELMRLRREEMRATRR